MNRWAALGLVALVAVSAGCAGVGPAPLGPGAPGESPTAVDASTDRIHTVDVVDVVDGDTMDVRYANGTSETVRLLGVDTPEVTGEPTPSEFEGIPDTEAGRDWLREWGYRASDYARAELAGETVRIEVDARSDVRGSYGRLLVYLYVDGDLFNLALLERGYARLYDTQFSKRAAFSEAAERANAEGVGLWGYGEGSGGTATGDADLEVVEIHADAEGDDHENRNDEYVVFENAGTESLALSGWRVSDEAGRTYVFPDGFLLHPGRRVTLYTGAGTDTETSLYWHSEVAIWNNGGDTVSVSTDGGGVVYTETYG